MCYEGGKNLGDICIFDEACLTGYCKPNRRDGWKDVKHPGTCSCKENSDCPEKLECDAAGRCEPHDCQVPHGDCPQGQFCLAYVTLHPSGRSTYERYKCQDLYPNGADCTGDAQCLSNVCRPYTSVFVSAYKYGTCSEASSANPQDTNPQDEGTDSLAAAQQSYGAAIQALNAVKEVVDETKSTLEETKTVYSETKNEKIETKQAYVAAKADYKAADTENKAAALEEMNAAKADYQESLQSVTAAKTDYTAAKTAYTTAKAAYAGAKRTVKTEAAALKAAKKAYEDATE
ncbi:hypothetical protein A3J91_03380 [Candidatus Peribacteria bacterium RIFOXYC2_FULL_58_10]|nr:MAG: hypothetical protein A3J91_03380 [Candidatus Peribacteria bacterium RIFOXYC2_FULL_58_10]OGJ85317.1 MAG: hypothetical protein A2529_02530 [Candidatus Peribacteria bacterium RIFOXYD2_FULL_58_15]HAS34479.1 hypothetical protein [Candidatus Peribacteria bacterium]